MVDVSHSNDRTTFDIIEQSSKPVMPSHGGSVAIYDHPRNRSDVALRTEAEQGGVVGIYEPACLIPGMEQLAPADYMRHLVNAIQV